MAEAAVIVKKDIDELSEDRKRYLDELVEKARIAATAFQSYTQEEVDRITREVVIAGVNNAFYLAKLAVDETKMGVLEDKVIKNMVASEFTWDFIKDQKTVGIINEDKENNIMEVAEPHGVIFALTPVTNPTSTVIFKSILAMKTRNVIIFSPHSRAAKCSAEAARLMYEAALRAGAPKYAIQWIENPTRQDTEYLFRHEGVNIIFATGGNNMVKAAYSSGKPAYGVGSGNTPVYIHKTANIEMAVMDVMISKSFDNGTVCASEQTLIVDEEIYDEVLEKLREWKAYILNKEEAEKVRKKIIHRSGFMHPNMIGKSAVYIAEKSGIKVPEDTKVLVVELERIGKDYLLSYEKLMPVLGIYKVKSVQDAINAALDINYLGGTGHTSSIFAEDEEVIRKFSEYINTGRIVVNSPSSIGALGGVYNKLIPTFSFGCGSGGNNITMDNINVKHFLNIKKVAKRTPVHMWFRVPNQIYFNLNAIENIRNIKINTAIIITTQGGERRGYVTKLKDILPQRVHIHTVTDIKGEPTIDVIMRSVEVLKRYEPDTIIAIGGGSVLDAAKAIRLFYENPNFNFEEAKIPFLDPRKRIVQFQEEDNYHHIDISTGNGSKKLRIPKKDSMHKVKIIAIPTTSGTGSEVTPYSVVRDKTGVKVTLIDYSLIPDVAIVDPAFTLNLPKKITADTGFDALTHAIESMASIFNSEYTEGLALRAIHYIFRFLPVAYKNPEDLEARTALHNSATIAGIAISNAGVGINHAMAHALEAVFNITHGRANAILLPYTIKYNSEVPFKPMPAPNLKHYRAPNKYALISDVLGWGGKDTQDKVSKLINKILELQKEVDIPHSLKDFGIDEEVFKRRLSKLVQLAMNDPSWKTNPRLPLITEITKLFEDAYYGRI